MALSGIRVIEFAGLAPAPFCGMILADFGAEVTKIDRIQPDSVTRDFLTRGKRSIAVDLKSNEGSTIVKKLCSRSDVVLEPYRPGVMEKLGLGPGILMEKNPMLIYARLTGYGQNGIFKERAGHDLNYLAISGVLSKLGRKNDKPTPSINLLADFAGGGLLCAFGIVTALFERTRSKRGQIIDANMVEGASYVSSFLFKSSADKFLWGKPRGCNVLDSGSPIYDTYETADGKFVALAALEPQFLAQFLSVSDIQIELNDILEKPDDIKMTIADKIKTKSRDEWAKIFAEIDACLTPVLEFQEAFEHPHNKNKQSFLIGPSGRPEPRPAPRLETTPAEPDLSEPLVGQHTVEILREIGYNMSDIKNFIAQNVVRQAEIKAKM